MTVVKDLLINASAPYHAYVGSGLLRTVGARLQSLSPFPASVMVVTDTHVAPLYLEAVKASIRGCAVHTHIFPAGEEHKTPETVFGMVRAMAQAELTRSDLVLALGGGVAGDMAGFDAAVYLRGIRFVQLPTTLLCAVDASVGGKTAVDLPEGKNLMGAFHQPSMVICDPDTFATLPEARIADGAAEMVKHGVIADAGLFGLMAGGEWRKDMADAVARNMEIKRRFVTEDEHDSGQRQLLNFGHTIGHALEARSGFTLSHGQAVAIGMVMETRAARRMGLTGLDEAVLMRALEANGLPVSAQTTADSLLAYTLRDKKRSSAGITVAVPEAIGKAHLRTLTLDDFRQYLNAACETEF